MNSGTSNFEERDRSRVSGLKHETGPGTFVSQWEKLSFFK